MNRVERIREATHHAKEATKLFKRSIDMHRAVKDGLIEKSVGRDAAIKLSSQALEEAEKASQLRKEVIEELDTKS